MFGFFFSENIISGMQRFDICPHVLVEISIVVFFFRFSSRKSQMQKKTSEKITHFAIQFCYEDLTHFTNLNPLDIENNMLPQQSQKPF